MTKCQKVRCCIIVQGGLHHYAAEKGRSGCGRVLQLLSVVLHVGWNQVSQFRKQSHKTMPNYFKKLFISLLYEETMLENSTASVDGLMFKLYKLLFLWITSPRKYSCFHSSRPTDPSTQPRWQFLRSCRTYSVHWTLVMCCAHAGSMLLTLLNWLRSVILADFDEVGEIIEAPIGCENLGSYCEVKL